MSASQDKKFMLRAIELAEFGRGYVSPNPVVGCVLVKDGLIIGEGWHKKFGEDHAEVNALNSVTNKELIIGSTAYVTLEPCAHFGNTPPCANRLVEEKVGRVVIGHSDPNPKVNGGGIKILEDAGIEVEVGVCEEECKYQNRVFLKNMIKNRPYFILKWAQTADGFVARENFDSKWISNELSRQQVHKLRAELDGILVGYNTVIHDNPSLTTRSWPGRNPVRIILDPENKLYGESLNIFNDEAQTIIFNLHEDKLDGNIRFVRVKSLDPNEVSQKLFESGVKSCLIEGGSKTLKNWINSGEWDEAIVFNSSNKFGRGINAPVLPESKILKEEKHISGDIVHHWINN
ncbi:bifunctional diaminohydroxyphosphoribosylaminopyrimidine deaminase/5-amino-6-(5-phosphoribosylamino)uracil reductase RibD [Marinigracilibium pacificum]|uniref:Riboflavin biosynthesis protein RibD n=1 Tax=Marinigracilibium pacificum TaxID=2729599 RepID=A0A848IUJ7_9BACT|nr:bifunctional diaminohydroxyphosphoribosylaminopyrimidine deaminase/5-amino-6-(5-phosphoribosylamino)uracil reductase RibD [Marinigracilibium pacificum]NMM46868.1 bifunctional diaminohydroxyphosphoribosylaminopyrimidine deaminase/5-amino-6-(5-phosphoribosylamino)uracil reductase RibD [Marinigracilibium pacificum]